MIPKRNHSASWRRITRDNRAGNFSLRIVGGGDTTVTLNHPVSRRDQPTKQHNMGHPSLRLVLILVCQYLIFSTTTVPGGISTHALSSKSTISQDFQRGRQQLPRSFREFQFAPNGVCVYPHCFVEHVGPPTTMTTTMTGKDNGDTNTTAPTMTVNSGQPQRKNFFTMRNVPGDGDCMFLAVALAAATSMGLGGNDVLLRAISKETRAIVAQILDSPSGTNLYISPGNVVDAARLLQSAVRQEPTIDTKEEYLQALRTEGRDGGLYGGGPELAVLANVLRRPISVYEVDVDRLNHLQAGRDTTGIVKESSTSSSTTNGSINGPTLELNKDDQSGQDDDEVEGSMASSSSSSLTSCFPIICKGSFGDGIFEDPCLTSIQDSAVLAASSSSGTYPGAYSWRLHILVLDVSPNGEKHACVLLPQPT